MAYNINRAVTYRSLTARVEELKIRLEGIKKIGLSSELMVTFENELKTELNGIEIDIKNNARLTEDQRDSLKIETVFLSKDISDAMKSKAPETQAAASVSPLHDKPQPNPDEKNKRYFSERYNELRAKISDQTLQPTDIESTINELTVSSLSDEIKNLMLEDFISLYEYETTQEHAVPLPVPVPAAHTTKETKSYQPVNACAEKTLQAILKRLGHQVTFDFSKYQPDRDIQLELMTIINLQLSNFLMSFNLTECKITTKH